MFEKDRLLLYNWTMKSHNYDMQPRAEALYKRYSMQYPRNDGCKMTYMCFRMAKGHRMLEG